MPYTTVRNIKTVNAINKNNGNWVCYDEETKQLFILDNNSNIVFTKPISNIIEFQGTKTLVIIYKTEGGSKSKYIGGMTSKVKIEELKKLKI